MLIHTSKYNKRKRNLVEKNNCFRQLFLHEVCTPYAYLLLGFLSTKKNAKTNICPTHVNEIIELYVLWLNYKLDGREAVAQSVIKETAQQKSSKTIILISLYLHRSSKVKTNDKIPTKGIHLKSPGCFRLNINNTEIQEYFKSGLIEIVVLTVWVRSGHVASTVMATIFASHNLLLKILKYWMSIATSN